jgi:glycosyltransferase involved in cell wall biosynthesis
MKMKVCMIAYTFYEFDGRVKRYAESLAQRGDDVDILALSRHDSCENSEINGVKVYQLQTRKIDEKGKFSYLYRIMKFLFKSSFFLLRKQMRGSYDLIHIHSVPDFLVFAGLIPKLFGAKIILDIHDILPEFYISKFGASKESTLFKALLFTERISIWFSDHVIISNHIWHKTLVSRSVKESKCTALLNYPDDQKFFWREKSRNGDTTVFIYPGSLNWHQGIDLAIKAFDKIKDKIPRSEFHIYGGGPETDNLNNLVKELNLESRVKLKGSVGFDKISEVMANADIGLVPKRNDFFGGEAFSTKILEFMCMGIPVIVSKTTIDNYYFDDDLVYFFEPDNKNDLAKVMENLVEDKEHQKKLANNGLSYIKTNNWTSKKQVYFDLVDRLTGY